MTSEISPSKDFVDTKAHNNHSVSVETTLVCPCLSTNRASLELQSLLSQFFFSKFEQPIGGVAYMWTFTVIIVFVQYTVIHFILIKFRVCMCKNYILLIAA